MKVSKLLCSVNSYVYELVRRDNMAEYVTCHGNEGGSDNPLLVMNTEGETTEQEKASSGGQVEEEESLVKRLRSRTKQQRAEGKTKAQSTGGGAAKEPKHQASLPGRPPRKLRKVALGNEDTKNKEHKQLSVTTRQATKSRLSRQRAEADATSRMIPPKELRSLMDCWFPQVDLNVNGGNRSRGKGQKTSTGEILTRSRKRKLEEEAVMNSAEGPSSSHTLRRSGRTRQRTETKEQRRGNKHMEGGNATRRKGKGRAGASSSRGSDTFDVDVGGGGDGDGCDPRVDADASPPLQFEEWERQNSRCYCGEVCIAGTEEEEEDDEEEKAAEVETDEGRRLDLLRETLSGHRSRCKSMRRWNYETDWVEPEFVQYRRIAGWPHLNECTRSLEVLNIGGTNVLGEFLPFVLLNCPSLRSLGQWLNTTVYGIEILRALPGHERTRFQNLVEVSYSTDRNYFCQPYIGFVPETKEFV